MQMILGQTGGVTGPSKNEIDDGAPASPWANLLSVGLRVLTALLGGPQQSVDGIDKVDNQSSPMQVCAVSHTHTHIHTHCGIQHLVNYGHFRFNTDLSANQIYIF